MANPRGNVNWLQVMKIYSLSTVACLAIIWLASIQFFSLEVLFSNISENSMDRDMLDAGDYWVPETKRHNNSVRLLDADDNRLWTVGKDVTFHVTLLKQMNFRYNFK